MPFDMCSVFLSFLFLQKSQVAIDKLVVSHESEKMMPETTSIIERRLTNIEFSSQRVVDELKVSFEESMTEDQEKKQLSNNNARVNQCK